MDDPKESGFVEIFKRYSSALRRANALDFDDIIAETVYLFRAFPDVAALYQRRFRHVLVDEYQDTNHAQYALIREFVRAVAPQNVPADTRMRLDANGGIPGASLTVVGDSDQSIYAFRGADIRNITEFERDFPNSKVILLEQNYRSTQNILDAANAVISNNFDRKAKNLFTVVGAGHKIIGFTGYSGHDEAQFVADEIETLRSAGGSLNDIAVFVRTNSQTRPLEEIFIRSAIPYRIPGGTKFYERAEVKDAMAYLIQVANPDDDLALRRIMNVPKRGIGPATEAAMQAHANRMGTPLREVLADAGQLGLGPKVTAAIVELGEILDDAGRVATTAAPHDILTDILNRTGYHKALKTSGDAQDEARAENLEELVSQTKEFRTVNPEGSLVDFLTGVALFAAADEIDDEDGSVSIMTLHTAKGLEYDAVFLTGVEEDLLPHRMSAQRARRASGGAAALLRRHHPRPQAPVPLARRLPRELRRGERGDAEPLPAGDPGRAHRVEAVRRRWRFPRPTVHCAPRPMRDSYSALPPAPPRVKTEWTSAVTGLVRDNGDMTLEAGDRIRHTDFGEGKVTAVTGEGTKRVAEVQFDTAGRKRLLIKIAPIEKL